MDKTEVRNFVPVHRDLSWKTVAKGVYCCCNQSY